MEALAEIIGDSPAIVRLREQLQHIRKTVSAARRPPPLLISGETGTGKGLLARTLHRISRRAHAPFVDVNCAAIPEHLLEAELFGFERGAFTDAHQAKPGLFQTAHRGTLFLDEVALLPEALQAKLLKVLEDGSVRRLGATRAEPVDVWILAATNEDLPEALRARRFRDDLYHRLAVVSLALPPLRERGPDILLLAERFLIRACADYGLAPKTLSAEARAALLAYHWPGNVRELSNVIERAALLVDRPVFSVADLALPATAAPSAAAEPLAGSPLSSRDQMREHLLEVLTQSGWNISRTATLLGVARNTVIARMRRFGLEPPNERTHGGPPGDTLAAHRGPPPGIPRIPPREPAPARWERRHLTFLRADLVLSPTAGSPDASRALAGLAEKVESFGGRLEEQSPTAIVATFGLGAVEDAPSRAALAAITVQKASERARGVEPAAPTVSIAVHVGDVMVGQVSGAIQIDLAGKQAVLTALEGLVSLADAGAIVVSEPTRPFLERRFELMPVSITGGAYRLTRREPTGFGLGGRPLTLFVGRAGELQIVADRVAQAERRQGQVVALVGEPGVGKSRFVYELTRWERMREWRVLGCGGVSHGMAVPFLPIADLLRRYFQIEDADAPPRVAEKVCEKIAQRRELESDLAPLLALLDGPVDDPRWQALDPPQRRQRTLDAVKRALVAESHIQPLLLVVEDLQWIDAQTQAVLDSLVDGVPTARILVLVSYRPEYRHQWGSKTYYSQARIDALPPAHARELLRWLVGDDATLDSLKDLLIARTEGNPFFLEESVRTLVETRALVGNRGAYRAGPVATIEVPATVQMILAARIDRLPADDKQLLQTASVIGKEVPLVLLHAVAEAAEDAVQRGLTHLQAGEFLYETRLFPDPEYTFKHALTHEVVYGTLPEDRRKALHARIVGAIERRAESRLSEEIDRLAHHAYRGEVWSKAASYLRQVGSRAFLRSAYREAVALFEQALSSMARLPDSPQRTVDMIDVRFDLRHACFPLGEFGRMERYLREAGELAEKLDDRQRSGWVAAYMTHLCWQTGRLRDALAFGQDAAALAEAGDDSTLRVASNFYLGQACLASGEYRRAEDFLRANTTSGQGDLGHERIGLAFYPLSTSHAYLAWALGEQGRFDEATSHGEEAIRLADAVGHAFSLVVAFWCLGNVHGIRGDVAEAIRLLERGLAMTDEIGLDLLKSRLTSSLGHMYARAGRIDEALGILREALATVETMGAGVLESVVLVRLGEALAAAGQLDESWAVAQRALAGARAGGSRGQEAYALRLLAELRSRRGPAEWTDAESGYRGALALAQELGMHPLVAGCRLGLGRLCARGDRQRALDELGIASAVFSELNMPALLEETRTALKQLT